MHGFKIGVAAAMVSRVIVVSIVAVAMAAFPSARSARAETGSYPSDYSGACRAERGTDE